ncbi:MAG: hypothetical protein WKF86_09215 [Acidimicrobiales bacterium]
MRVWVAQLHISERTIAKIRGRHGLDPADLRDQIVCVSTLTGRFDEDPIRGGRIIVQVTIHGQEVIAVLYPSKKRIEGDWHLGSAYRRP